jgi:hypothetical protein
MKINNMRHYYLLIELGSHNESHTGYLIESQVRNSGTLGKSLTTPIEIKSLRAVRGFTQ